MKVLFITHYSNLYGANKSLLNLIEGLDGKVEALVLTPEDGQIIDELNKKKVKYIIQKYYSWVYIRLFGILKIPYKIIKNIEGLNNIKKQLKNFNPDIVYTNSSVVSMGYYISFYLKKPHIIHVREFGKMDYNIRFDFGKSGLRFFLNKASAIICISKAIDNIVVGKIKNKKFIIYNGVVTSSNVKVQPKNLDKEGITFSIIGLLMESKNQLDAVRAFKIFNNYNPNSRLFIAGAGEDYEYIEKLKKESSTLLNDNKIIFTGYLNDVDKLFAETDVLLMCSPHEGMGRVTVEAMACGIPTIGYNGGGTPELIEDGVNGLLYHGSYVDLSEKMKFISTNALAYLEFSINCLKKVRENYTQEKYAKEVYKVLVDVQRTNNKKIE